ncbi:unnamed protein product, partial [Schistosoma mattheei]
ARISWDHRVSNTVVRKRVLGKDEKSIDEVVKLDQLRWLGHVLRMPNHRLPRRAMLNVTINTGAAEKLRLAHLMTYGEEPTWKSLQNDQIKDGRLEYLGRRILKYPKTDGDNDDYNNKQIETNKDRFEECM